jgi:FMN phosphatase YigB (HAD superfamily)/ribulose-5-phosphate 4-epimerase/fuculose-1-phosphate aldolase
MFYKGIIFDLDNTLYDYDVCHHTALNEVFELLVQKYKSLTIEHIKGVYEEISKTLKYELGLTASSHNKSIYFKHLLEKLNIGLSIFLTIHDIYWDTFYSNMVCFEGVLDFLVFNKNIGKKMGILTDYETEYQIKKLERLGILNYIDVIVTSEEVGIEKPSSQMFSAILQKMNLGSHEVIMVGDNYERDFKGASRAKIRSYWFHKDNHEFTSFVDLHAKFSAIQNELVAFKQISKYCGERFDLVQAGGGNTSVKVNDVMFIKASGYNLTNIDENSGYVVINNKILLEDIHNNSVRAVNEYNFIGNQRGSIETFMHSILKKYTIHLHPIQINRILISSCAKQVIEKIYPSALIIDYITPGIKVCDKIKEVYDDQNVIFLLNHGIIITHDNISNIYNILDDVLERFETYQQLNFDKYKNTNMISAEVNNAFNVSNVSYLCLDEVINKYFIENMELFKQNITVPDVLIYCGVKYLFGIDNVAEYKNMFLEAPKIIIEKDSIYINSHSLAKCKEIEEVLRSNLIILDSTLDKVYLDSNEICFLNNWDAEKYRKLL